MLGVDAQVGLLDGASRAAETIARIRDLAARDLAARARAGGAPVVYGQHDGDPGGRLEIGTAGWRIHPDVAPADGDPVVRKRASDAFFETPLLDELRGRGVSELVVTGMKTQYCVDTTSRRAVTLGFDVVLAADGHTTTDGDVLTAEQIVAHTNETLDDFGTDAHVITVRPAAAVEFGWE